eukprot:TRINITY_DN2696_c0_g2_i1.p1 TRINITY_DN2696_c0_g2~~TRINITY_DN2696_c0_g2_i1.p1  ORF type:complete len:288 (+),score=46.05 TRINITY_DN2696_c0_g2_i1:45-908(+)
MRRSRKRALLSDESDEEQLTSQRSQSQKSQQTTKRKRIIDHTDEEQPITKKQRTQTGVISQTSKKGKAFSKLSRHEVEVLVGNVMRIMLYHESRKVPTKRVDLNKLVFDKYKGVFSDIMGIVKERFIELFDYEVLPVSKGKSKSRTDDHWILVNKHENSRLLEIPGKENYTIDEKKEYITLMAILSFIFMSNGSARVDMLMTWLRGSCVVSEEETKVPFEKQLIDQYYIVKNRIDAGNNEYTYEYTYGPRATAELGKIKIAEHVAFIHNEPLDIALKAELLNELQQQ